MLTCVSATVSTNNNNHQANIVGKNIHPVASLTLKAGVKIWLEERVEEENT